MSAYAGCARRRRRIGKPRPTCREKNTLRAIQDAVQVEIGSLLRVIVNARRKLGSFDLEALEEATRAALHRTGARLLEALLEETEREGQPPLCSCGRPLRCAGPRPKRLVSLLGSVRLSRLYYHCRHCWRGTVPFDRALDIEGTQYSPGVRRLLAVVGGETPFARGRELLAELAGIEVSVKAVERQAQAIGSDLAARAESDRRQAALRGFPPQTGEPIPTLYIEMDGTGIPVTAAAAAGRAGKDGGSARTREVKLGCVFTQTDLDAEGRPVRDARSTTYTGAIEDAEAFGQRIYHEAWRRGLHRAVRVVVLGDGAAWIWNISRMYFPNAIEIVDIYHAREHLGELGRQLFPQDRKQRRRWVRRRTKQLDEGRIEHLVRSLRGLRADTPELAEKLRTEAAYFEGHADRMRYAEFRRQDLFIGSGVIEAGCRGVIAGRLKRSGMFWTVDGANAIIALRCAQRSNRFVDYWEDRAAA